MLWQGIALVAMLVSVIAVGAGASMVYAGDGTMGGGASTSGGGASTSGGGASTSGGGASTSGGSINTSGSVVPGHHTFTVILMQPDPAVVITDGLPVDFCVRVYNITDPPFMVYPDYAFGNVTPCILAGIYKSVQDIGKVEITLPDELTYCGDLSAWSTNFELDSSDPDWTNWDWLNPADQHQWVTDDSGAPVLVATVPFSTYCDLQKGPYSLPDQDALLEVSRFDTYNQCGGGWTFGTPKSDFVDVCFCAFAPEDCSLTGPLTSEVTITTQAYWGCGEWDRVCPYSGGVETGPGCCCYWEWDWNWVEDCQAGEDPVVTVSVPECPPPPEEEVTPEPEVVPEVPEVPPPLFVPGLGEAPMTPVLSINMEGALARYPVTQDGKLLVNAITTSPDGMVTLSIPKGCPVLNADGTPAYLNPDPDVFSIAAANLAAPAGATILAAYQLQPAGISFPCDATIIIKYDANMLPAGKVPVIASYDGATGKWTNLETAGYVAGGVEVPNALQAHTGGTLYFAVLAQ
jgi:hypothetical protein